MAGARALHQRQRSGLINIKRSLVLALALLCSASHHRSHEWVTTAAAAKAASPKAGFLDPIARPGFAASIYRITDGTVIAAYKADAPRQPASVVKLITVGAVLDLLGGDYRFHTDVFHNGTTLFIKGHGDPYLISEEWQQLVSELPQGLSFDALVLDDSFFAPDLGIIAEPDVYSPYNARNGAFATNFNTVAFRIDAAGHVEPEAQTPWVDFLRVALEPSRQRTPTLRVQNDPQGVLIQVATRPRKAQDFRVNLGFAPETSALYAGHLFVALGKRAGRPWAPKTVERGQVPDHAVHLLRHINSRALAEVAQGLLKYSNNFVANQLVLAAGARALSPPATLEKGLEVLRRYATQLGLNHFKIFEASGLDPRNEVTATALTAFLNAQLKRSATFPALLVPMLSGRVRAKSGTFEDNLVRNLAGYVLRGDEPVLAFAFLCNGPSCSAQTMQSYEKILARLVASVDSQSP